MSPKLLAPSLMLGDDDSLLRKHIGSRRLNCFVKKAAVASGMTQNWQSYMCSNSCTVMFDSVEILAESVTAACLPFLPPVLEYKAITDIKGQRVVSNCRQA